MRRWPPSTAAGPSEIAVGNGSLELLLILGEALLERGVEVVFAKPSFALYRTSCCDRDAPRR